MRKIYLFIFGILFSSNVLFSQTGEENNLKSLFKTLESKYNVSIFSLEEFLPKGNFEMPEGLNGVEETLERLLGSTGLGYLNYKNHTYIIAPKDRLERDYSEQYFTNKMNQQKAVAEEVVQLEEIVVGSVDTYDGSSPIAVTGFLTDDNTEEPLIGATIMDLTTNEGTITDEIGKYELNFPTGEYILTLNAIGYVEKKIKLKIFSSGDLDLELSKEAINLNEVVVSSKAANENVTRGTIGLEALDIDEIKRLPAFLGEADVIKSLLLLPGVSSVGEGSGGINVRGGTVDQNLIMQDGMYLFNSAHVLGLFSLFNPDVVKNVNLYKGSMPARFGGRLSSVLDVELKEGNYQKFTGKGGLGLVSSRLTFEAPIKKGSSSVILGTRFSFSDYIFDLVNVADIQESSAFFYDGNFKFTQRFGNKGKFAASAYVSQDRFKFSDQFDFRWGTKGASFKFNYLLSDRLSFNLEGVYSEYLSSWDEPNTNRAFKLENGISYYKLRPEFSYKLGLKQDLNFGLEGNRYTVNPGEINPTTSESNTIPDAVPEEKGRDFAFYLNDDIEINSSLSISLGVRYAVYQSLGPGEVTLYEPRIPLLPTTAIGTETYGSGDVIKTYSGIEPRASLRYTVGDNASIKMSYNRTQQFINQISNTTAVSPVDIWQLSNTYLKPLTAHNYSVGFFKNLKEDLWETSFEVFYRDIDNLIEYKDLANLLVNDHLETEIIPSIGRSYGVEVSLKKTRGRFTGWLGYTYSRTERRTNGQFLEETINENQWFLSNFDRPHDLSLVLTFQANKRSHLGINFVYSSGRPVTAPVGSFSSSNVFNIPVYSERNAFRIPAYHRMDISYTIGQSHRKNQNWRSSWTFSIFNIYGRRNPFSVYFTQQAFQNPKANRLSVLGSIIPSINYNFSF